MRHHGSLVKKINAAHGVSNHLVFTDVSSIGAKVQRSFQLSAVSFQFLGAWCRFVDKMMYFCRTVITMNL